MGKIMPQTLEQTNELISYPKKLLTNDGREILITKWEPCLAQKHIPSVKIEGILIAKKEEDETNKI